MHPPWLPESLKDLPGFVNLLPILAEEKGTSGVLRVRFSHGILPGGKAKATVFFHGFPPRVHAEAVLKGKVDEVLPDSDPRIVHVVASPERIRALADLDEVARVEDFLDKLYSNDVSRTQSRVDVLQAPVLDTLSFPPTPAWNSGRTRPTAAGVTNGAASLPRPS